MHTCMNTYMHTCNHAYIRATHDCMILHCMCYIRLRYTRYVLAHCLTFYCVTL